MNHQKKPGYKRNLLFKKIKVSFNSFISDWFGDISILDILKKLIVFLFLGLTVYIIFFLINDYQKKQNYMYQQQRLLERELRLEEEQQRREEEQQRREEEQQRLEEEQQRREFEQQIQERNNFLKKIKKIPSSIVENKIFIELDWNFGSRKLFTITTDWLSSKFKVTNESNWKIERIELSYNYFSSFNNSFLKEEKIILENYHFISQFSSQKGELNINNKRGLPLSTETYYVPSNYKNSENQYIKWKIEGIYGYELSN